jgi:hypothetical protein
VPRLARVVRGAAIAIAGLALAIATSFPSTDTTVTGLRAAGARTWAGAALRAVLELGQPFRGLLITSIPLRVVGFTDPEGGALVWLLTTAFLVLVAIRHRRHPDLLATFLISTFGLAWFFLVAYPAWLRHVGLLFVLILALEWIARRRESTALPASRERRVFAWALSIVLGLHVLGGAADVAHDLATECSSSKAFASFLRSRPELRDAIVIGEPDYLIESLPYYTTHRLYSVEEGRMFRWVRFSRGVRDPLTLGQVLDTVDSLGRHERVPILLALGFSRVMSDTAGSISYRYGSLFTWTAAEDRRLHAETVPIAAFTRAAGDERYIVLRARGR